MFAAAKLSPGIFAAVIYISQHFENLSEG